MNEADIDRRLGALLREPAAATDHEFVDRVLVAARLDREFRRARRRDWKRALIECAGAIAVGGTFYLLTQEQPPLPDGMMSLQGPAMAGLVMLALWGLVSSPTPGGPARRHAAP